MSEIQYLSKAPIIEAILGVVASAAKQWDPESIRPRLAEYFPEHPELQELRGFQAQIKGVPDAKPTTETTAHGIIAFFCKSPEPHTVHQVRRDGYAFSQMEPYPTWESFTAAGLKGWEAYNALLGPLDAHRLFVRFINRLRFPLAGFKLADYFISPPVPPADTEWGFHHFQNTALYDVGDERFAVKCIFSVVPEDCDQKEVAFLLDTTIEMKRSLDELDDSMDNLLEEMRGLKNKAFFNILTPEAISPYL